MIGNIYITGQIGTTDDEVGVELIDVIQQVKRQPNALSFNVHINSPGGIVDTGFDIYEYLKNLGKPVTTIGSGMVASIATVIFMAGEKRVLKTGTEFMIHLPWMEGAGTAADFEKYTEELKYIEKRLLNFYQDVTSIGSEGILPLLKNETFLTSEQAKDLGFTTEAFIPIAAKAYLNLNHNTMNQQLTEENKTFFKGLFDGFEAKIKSFMSSKPKNKLVQDANGAELDFADLADDATPQVGDKAMIDGAPAEGEYVMPSGETYVFAAGELTEIKPADGGDNADMEALKAENEALKQQLSEVTATATEASNTVVAMKKEFTALKSQITSKFDLDTTTNPNPNPDGQPQNRAAGYKKK